MTANMQGWRQLARTKSSVTKRCQSGPSGWQAIFRISWGTPASIKGQKGGTEKSKGFPREVPLVRKIVLRPEAKRNILGSWTERIWLFQGRQVVRQWRQSKSQKKGGAGWWGLLRTPGVGCVERGLAKFSEDWEVGPGGHVAGHLWYPETLCTCPRLSCATSLQGRERQGSTVGGCWERGLP